MGDDGASSGGGSVSARMQSSYIISLRELDVKHVKDFIFVHGKKLFNHIILYTNIAQSGRIRPFCSFTRHEFDSIKFIGYIEPVLVILHEKELTWSGRLPYKHHTCAISALSISTTLKQHPLIWSATVSSYLFNKHVALYISFE